jgi:hypothetical protein
MFCIVSNNPFQIKTSIKENHKYFDKVHRLSVENPYFFVETDFLLLETFSLSLAFKSFIASSSDSAFIVFHSFGKKNSCNILLIFL